MQKTDSKELKKQLKNPENCIVDWVFGFYVNTDNEVVWKTAKNFYEFEEEEQFRHLGILNKVISCGKDSYSLQTEQNEYFQNIDFENIEKDMDAMQEVFLAQPVTYPYYVTVTHLLYDVPVKASDGAVLEDSGLYDGYVLAVCPAKLSTPALGFDNGAVTDLSRRWTIGAPICGCLYPSFNERAADLNEVVFFKKKGSDILYTLFEIKEDALDAEEQKTGWNEVLSSVGVTSEDVSLMNEAIREADVGSLGCAELKTMAEEIGLDGDKFEEAYEEAFGDKELSADAISAAKIEVKTDSAKIQVPAENAAFIKMKKIDGIEYILIPADGAVTVNGTEIRGTKNE